MAAATNESQVSFTTTSVVAREAIGRIGELVTSLRGFAQLDEAEVQRMDLRESLDNVLSLIPADIRGEVVVEKRYADVPEILCRPAELN